MPGENLETRFWRYVEKSDGDACWEWKASVGSHGYPQLAYKNSKVTGHTLSWRIHFGEIPVGLCVLHRCDNRRCTNPFHLFLGTKKDNLEDMTKKGRRVRGQTHGRSKLSDDQVRQILAMDGMHKDIAAQFGVHRATITQIKTRAYWKHIDGGGNAHPH